MAKKTTTQEPEPLPPPPPWAGEQALSQLVSAAIEVPAPTPAPVAADEFQIDLDDLDVDPRLLARLREHFAGDAAAVDRALSRYCGRYESLIEYATVALEGVDLPEWLWPYIDVDGIVRDWLESGALWILDDRDDVPGVHVFGG